MTTHNIQWEYMMQPFNFISASAEIKFLDAFGSHGWELVSITKEYFYFKRPKITTPTKQEP